MSDQRPKWVDLFGIDPDYNADEEFRKALEAVDGIESGRWDRWLPRLALAIRVRNKERKEGA